MHCLLIHSALQSCSQKCCICGALSALIDPAGNKTQWLRDLDSKVIQKIYADGTSYNYSYVPNRELLRKRTDAMSQNTVYSYTADDALQTTNYTNAVNPTSAVATTYDTTYPRTIRQSNGWGDINYQYNPYVAGGSNKAYIFVGGYPQTPNATDTVNVTFTNSALSGGTFALPTYSVVAGDAGNPAAVATHLAAAITANSTLSAAGISATANGTAITVSAGGPVTVVPTATGSTTATVGGAGRVSQVSNSVIANSAISYSYDSLERTVNRMINGANNKIIWAYDAMSRVVSELNPLGSTPFSYAYVDDTPGSSKGDTRLSSITYPNGQTANYAYLPTVQDERLQQIKNLTPSASVLSQFNYAYNSAGEIKQWQQQQNSTNSHYDLGYDAASQLTSAVVDSGSAFKLYVSGTVHTGDVLSLTAYDASLTGSAGQETASYTVQAGDTLATIATALSSSINSAMSNISVTASANTTTRIISVNTSANNATSLRVTTSAGATATLALSESSPIPNLHKQFYYSYDCAGNRTGNQTDSTGTLASGLTTTATGYSYNNVNELVASAPGGPIKFAGTTTNPIASATVNVAQTVTIGGTVTAGDTVGIVVHDKALPQARKVAYAVVAGDTTTSIATALKSAVNSDTTLTALGVSATSSSNLITLSSQSANSTFYFAYVGASGTETATLTGGVGATAALNPSTSFVSQPKLLAGANKVTVIATSGGGAITADAHSVNVTSAAPVACSYDANGNLINDGANVYSWDVENRLLKITPSASSNFSEFTYDALGQMKMVSEKIGASTTQTYQLFDKFDEVVEKRISAATEQRRFDFGEQQDGQSYFYSLDHLSSIRELCLPTGVITGQYTYSPFGEKVLLQGSMQAWIGFAGMMAHQTSGLNWTLYRFYSPGLARWLSRDPIGEAGGLNLLAYVQNEPINSIDPLGAVASPSGWGGGGPFPPCFPNTDDPDSCGARGRDCQQKCREFYRNKPGPGNDFLDQCLRCCAQVVPFCRNWGGPGPFPGRKWSDCFKNPRNKFGRPGRPSNSDRGIGMGGEPPPDTKPPKKTDLPSF